jgi:hypothetical protein
MKCSNPKIVVFDLDETLGYFMEFGMFWDAFKKYLKYINSDISIDQQFFNNLIDLYPEFLRPHIIDILNYIKKKKIQNKCDKLMVYTNNQGPEEWAKFIIKYFENKINFKIFDQIIAAFKVNGKQVELCRTTHLKTHSDLIKCTKLPLNTQICFLDDVFYPDMSNDNIYYINVKPYIHDLSFDDMIKRLLNSEAFVINNKKECREFISEFLKQYNYIFVEKEKDALNIDVIVSKKILHHLHIFFKSHTGEHNKTKKRHVKKSLKNKTIKYGV